MAQNFYTDYANHSLDGIDEIVINAVEADITLVNANGNQISWEPGFPSTHNEEGGSTPGQR